MTKSEIILKYKDLISQQSLKFNRDYSKLFFYLKSSSFFDEPAAVRYHNNFPGGLALHTLNFFEVLEKLIENFPEFNLKKKMDTMFDPLIVAIGHDLNKVGRYTIEDKNKKINNQWCNFKAYGYNNSVMEMYPSTNVSLNKINSLLGLSESERLAIFWAEGLYATHSVQDWQKALGAAIHFDHRVYLSHVADMISSQFMEAILSDEEVDKAIREWK